MVAPPGAAPGCTWGLGQSRWYLVLHTPPTVHPPPQKVLYDLDVFLRHCRLNWHVGILVRLKFQPCNGCNPSSPGPCPPPWPPWTCTVTSWSPPPPSRPPWRGRTWGQTPSRGGGPPWGRWWPPSGSGRGRWWWRGSVVRWGRTGGRGRT